MSQNDRKRTQRARLLAGIVEVAAQEGYQAANVARVIAHAGVSRPTFYDYFPDRESCFLAAHEELARGLAERVSAAIAAADPARALYGAIAALVDFARAEPRAARFLMHAPTTAGAAALDAHDHAIAALARIVERRHRRSPPDAPCPDVFVPSVLGSVYLLLSLRLRRGERDLAKLAGELERWLAAYGRPRAQHRWHSLTRGPRPPRSPFVSETALYPPPPLPSGRAGLSPDEVSHNHRERILFACLTTSGRASYAQSTIADIAAVAGIDRRVFYKHFRDKRDAFEATLEFGFQQSIAVTATAFFSAPTWPERVWEAARAFTQFLAINPALTRFAFLDAYTIGPAAVHRFEDLRSAYTIFLQEGLQQPRGGVRPPSAIALEAIAAIVFQAIYYEIRHEHTDQLGRLLPQMAHLCLTPFLGVADAEALIDDKLRG